MRAELAQATKQIADSIISDMIKLIEDDENDNYLTYFTGSNITSQRLVGGFMVTANRETKKPAWHR
jgi:hypothetical protein